MKTKVKLEFVSDISCTWCAIGLQSLQQAIAAVASEIDVEVDFQPFELNPAMPAGGQNLTEHIGQKYGSSPAAWVITRGEIIRRGAEVGFLFRLHDDSRIYNTFDAHRLLHWARLEGRQMALKQALFLAHLSEGEDPGSHAVLQQLAAQVGLDAGRAKQILESAEYADEVRAQERKWREIGVSSVPTMVLDGVEVLVGSRPAEAYVDAIRRAAAAQTASS